MDYFHSNVCSAPALPRPLRSVQLCPVDGGHEVRSGGAEAGLGHPASVGGGDLSPAAGGVHAGDEVTQLVCGGQVTISTEQLVISWLYPPLHSAVLASLQLSSALELAASSW